MSLIRRRFGQRAQAAWLCAIMLLTASGGEAPDASRGDLAVRDADGREWTGILSSLTPERLVLAGETTHELPLAGLRSAEFAGRRAVPFERGSSILLANGDRLVAEPLVMDDVHLTIHWRDLPGEPPVKVPLETIRGVIFNAPQTSAPRTRLLRLLEERSERSDLLVLENGDRVAGELTGIGAESLTLEGPVGETQLHRAGVRAIGFNPELISFPEQEGPRVLVQLVNGSTFAGERPRLEANDRLYLEAAFGPMLNLPLSAVASIRFEGGRVVPLSDLEPAKYEYTPYLSGERDLKRDRSIEGGPLRLRGREYPRGLGMHSRSAVTYDLGGGYRRFEATVGIDDAAQGGGNAVFAVEVDGERVYTSPALTGTDPPLELPPIDLAGKQRLTLVVEYGERADIQDHADWCDAVLVK